MNDRIAKWLGVPAMAIGMSLVLSGCGLHAKQGFDDKQKQSESYSLGYQTGNSLKKQKVDIDLDVYLSAIRDALAEKQPELGQNEMRMALSEMAKRIQANQHAELVAKAEKNLTESRTFLEGNKGKEGVQVLPSGLQYKVLKRGAGVAPGPADIVTVNYRGTFTNGTEFASSYAQNKPQTANLSRTIPGWKEALQLMKEGSRWEIFVPPDLAYGARGSTGIEPNSALIFDVDLISVTKSVAGNRQ